MYLCAHVTLDHNYRRRWRASSLSDFVPTFFDRLRPEEQTNMRHGTGFILSGNEFLALEIEWSTLAGQLMERFQPPMIKLFGRLNARRLPVMQSRFAPVPAVTGYFTGARRKQICNFDFRPLSLLISF